MLFEEEEKKRKEIRVLYPLILCFCFLNHNFIILRNEIQLTRDLVNGFIPCGSVTITIANVDMITAKWNITSECCVMTIVILHVKH